MKKSSLIKIIAMALVLCMLFTSCDLFKKTTDDPQPAACQHTKTELKNAVPATCTTTGYTGDKVCTDCGATVEKGAGIAMTAHKTKIRGAKAEPCDTKCR